MTSTAHRSARSKSTQRPLLHLVPTPRALTGILALVVTDLEGFTTQVSRMGDHAARAWIRAHNTMLRATIQRHAGCEVAHTGDGMIAAYRSVRAALSSAQEFRTQLAHYSREHSDAPLRARIGIHAGEPLPEDGRLFGLSLNIAVRVCEGAKPEQILVTEVVRQLALGTTFTFEALEASSLKGITSQLQLHELRAANADS